MEENCHEIEELNIKHCYINLHRKMKKLSASTRKSYPLVVDIFDELARQASTKPFGEP